MASEQTKLPRRFILYWIRWAGESKERKQKQKDRTHFPSRNTRYRQNTAGSPPPIVIATNNIFNRLFFFNFCSVYCIYGISVAVNTKVHNIVLQHPVALCIQLCVPILAVHVQFQLTLIRLSLLYTTPCFGLTDHLQMCKMLGWRNPLFCYCVVMHTHTITQ
jgi:hypothetical protein